MALTVCDIAENVRGLQVQNETENKIFDVCIWNDSMQMSPEIRGCKIKCVS